MGELRRAETLHWSMNGEGKMSLPTIQLMLGVNIFTESPPLIPACPLSHVRISLTLGDSP